MKLHLLTILLLSVSITVSATTYYVSNTGDDSNSGLTEVLAWKTIDKINSYTEFTAGDNILFKRGDTFYGTIRISQSGSAGSPIVFGAYGFGDNPVITGLKDITVWTDKGSNIWESSSSVSTLAYSTIVVINGVNIPMGRYPNTDYLTFQSHSGITSITSSALTGSPDWTGAELVIKKNRWVIDRDSITAQSGGTLTYTGGTAHRALTNSTNYSPIDGYGFFIQNDIRTLDQQNEWYYNPVSKKLSIYSTSTPSGVKIATLDTLISLPIYSHDYTFKNLTFTGCNNAVLNLNDISNLTIDSCIFQYSYDGTNQSNWGGLTNNLVIQNSQFLDILNVGLRKTSEATNSKILNNSFKRIGIIVGAGGSGDGTYCATSMYGDTTQVKYNTVDSIGYNGIDFNSNVTNISYNEVSNYCLLKDDGAGIYTGDTHSGDTIAYNIVYNGGIYPGAPGTDGRNHAFGIYLDDYASGFYVHHNSIFDAGYSGIYIHNAKDCKIEYNNIYNPRGYFGFYASTNATDQTTTGIIFKQNTLLVGSALKAIGLASWQEDILSFGTIDSNYYASEDEGDSLVQATWYGNYDHYYSLSDWQSFSGYDIHSNDTSNIDLDDVKLVYNPSINDSTVNLNQSYRDIIGNIYSGDVNIEPYTSLILLKLPSVETGVYYVSNSGNDSNSGTDIDHPWQTINKVNSTTFAAGDSIRFKKDDTFYGKLIIRKSGTSDNPIIYTSYGSGANPIITGFTDITSWTNIGGNIWESTSTVSTLANADVVVINGKNTPMGRYPNSGYLRYTSNGNRTSIVSSSLTGTPDWSGADAVVRVNYWTADKTSISSQSGSTLTFSSPVTDDPKNNYGFFIQNDSRTLDSTNEWYYNPSTKKLRIYSTTEPTDVKIASVDTLVSVPSGSYNYIDFNGIDFIGGNQFGIHSYSSHTNITNCSISFIGEDGIRLMGSYNNVLNNIINDIAYTGLSFYYGSPGYNVAKNNMIRQIGMIEGVVINDYSGAAIRSYSTNSLIQYNDIDSCGYNGIQFRYSNTEVRNNFVRNFCLLRADGGGIYTGFVNETGKIIDGNIIMNGFGNSEATSAPTGYTLAQGIYLDDGATKVTVTNNTIAGMRNAGIKIHNADSTILRNNLFYDNGLGTVSFSKGQIEFIRDNILDNDIRGTKIYNNIFFSKKPEQVALHYSSSKEKSTLATFGTADSNYYAKPLGESNIFKLEYSGGSDSYNLSQWKTFTGQDANSLGSPKFVNSEDSMLLVYNPTDHDSTIALGGSYIDVEGNNYTAVTLSPYSAKALIKSDNINPIPSAQDLYIRYNKTNLINLQ